MDHFTQFTCFRVGTLSRRIIRFLNNQFAPLGITLGQSMVLFVLLDHDGSSVKDIAATIQIDSPGVTNMIDRLIREGFVSRQEDPEDRRIMQVFLTPRGRQVGEEALSIGWEINQKLNRTLTGDEITLLENSAAQLEGLSFQRDKSV